MLCLLRNFKGTKVINSKRDEDSIQVHCTFQIKRYLMQIISYNGIG